MTEETSPIQFPTARDVIDVPHTADDSTLVKRALQALETASVACAELRSRYPDFAQVRATHAEAERAMFQAFVFAERLGVLAVNPKLRGGSDKAGD
jgi:hypothetical protein